MICSDKTRRKNVMKRYKQLGSNRAPVMYQYITSISFHLLPFMSKTFRDLFTLTDLSYTSLYLYTYYAIHTHQNVLSLRYG